MTTDPVLAAEAMRLQQPGKFVIRLERGGRLKFWKWLAKSNQWQAISTEAAKWFVTDGRCIPFDADTENALRGAVL